MYDFHFYFYAWPFIHLLYFFFYARTHGKITWQWKSNFSLKMSVLTGCPYKAGYQRKKNAIYGHMLYLYIDILARKRSI